MSAPPSSDLEQLYRSGLSFRTIGRIIGRDESTVRYHLWDLPNYRSMVTKVLMSRVTHAQGRALKHAIVMLRQKRPAIFKRLLERSMPKRCSECSMQVDARLVAGMWRWSCAWCGAGGFAQASLRG